LQVRYKVYSIKYQSGNHKIWWRSFLTTGSMAIYIFGYAVFYYLTELELVRFSSIVMYFGYMLLISFTFFIFCGTIGFLSSYLFVRKIYSLIKID
jgi:Endomembrane protein 70.